MVKNYFKKQGNYRQAVEKQVAGQNTKSKAK